jgi:hypothetical protein
MVKPILIVVFACSLLTGCMDKLDNRNIKIANNTDKAIYCFLSKNDKFPEMRQSYDDSTLNDFLIEPHSTIDLGDPPIQSWDGYINNSVDQKCRILIYSKDTITKYGWEEVKGKDLYIKKYLLNIAVLDSIEWKISFNGI